jgi:hypothetical protein
LSLEQEISSDENVGLTLLPPREFWLIDPAKEKIDTPVDDFGLIDIPKLITVAKGFVDRAFQWSRKPPNRRVHHFYFPDSSYIRDTSPEATVNPAGFRNLPPNKGDMDLMFERWIHEITIPAAVPDNEVMAWCVESWSVSRDLFLLTRKEVRTGRSQKKRAELVAKNPGILRECQAGIDVAGEYYFGQEQDNSRRGLELALGRLERLPTEFRVCDPQELSHERIVSIGRPALKGSLNLISAVAA